MTDELKPPPKYKFLRKLRSGVTLRFNGYDADGVPHWLIYDAGRNNFFAIGWPEYEMLSRWNLGDGKAIIDAVNKDTTLNLELEDFENLRDFLYNNFLVEHRWRAVYTQAREHKLIKEENVLFWFLRYYLFFRIPLFQPDKFLDKTKIFADIIFNRYFAYFMFFLGLVALYQVGMRWDEFVHTFSTIFNLQGLFFYLIAFTIAKVFHEFGHAYMCKQYGVSVPTIGVAFLVFWPVMYTDTTLSWSLPAHQRLRITLAGMWVETYITIIAALIWCNVHNVVIQMICYITVAVNWVSTLLINVSPFMRFDGYYALSDILKTPNLQNRSFDLTRWQIRYWLFGLTEPMHEPFSPGMHRLLVAYAFITWAYRLVIYFGIALLVYHYFFKVVGIILFIIELYVFIARPIAFEFYRIYKLRDQLKWNFRTSMTLLAFLILISLLFLPLNQNIKLNSTLSYAHEFIYSPMEGVLQNNLPKLGAVLKAGEPIVNIQSMDVEYNLKKAELEYDKIITKIRRSSLNPSYAIQTGNLQAERNEKKADYEKWLSLKEKLEIKAPFDGRVEDVAIGIYQGVTVMKNEYLLDIVNPNRLIIEAFVEEVDFDILKVGDTGLFYPNNLDLPIIPVKVIVVEVLNARDLAYLFTKQGKQKNAKDIIIDTPSYLSSEFGGKIPTRLTDDGKHVPVDSVYRVLLVPTSQEGLNLKLNNIQIGTVTVSAKPRSFAHRTVYNIKNAFIKESGF